MKMVSFFLESPPHPSSPPAPWWGRDLLSSLDLQQPAETASNPRLATHKRNRYKKVAGMASPTVNNALGKQILKYDSAKI